MEKTLKNINYIVFAISQQLRRFLAFFANRLFFTDILMYDQSIKEPSQGLSLAFQGATLGVIKISTYWILIGKFTGSETNTVFGIPPLLIKSKVVVSLRNSTKFLDAKCNLTAHNLSVSDIECYLVGPFLTSYLKTWYYANSKMNV